MGARYSPDPLALARRQMQVGRSESRKDVRRLTILKDKTDDRLEAYPTQADTYSCWFRM